MEMNYPKIKIDPKSNIQIFVPFNVSHTPRAYNLINYLAGKVEKVTLITCIISSKIGETTFPNNVTSICLFDLTKNSLQTFLIKLRFKLARVLLEKFSLETRSSFGYGIKEFINASKKNVKNNNIIFCFKEIGLLVGENLLKSGCRNIIFDFEDWFSEDLPQKSRRYRPIKLLKLYEKNVIVKKSDILVPSSEMKLGLESTYGIGNFHIYYNSFNSNITETGLKSESYKIKLIWFSQTISFNRGLEDFFNILDYVQHPIHIDLIGTVDSEFTGFIDNKFKSYNTGHSYALQGFVKDHELDSYIVNAHFGLALEKPEIISRDLTITYKCFRYLMNATPLILSKTKGQEEFVKITSEIYPIINFGSEADIKLSAEHLNFLFLQVNKNPDFYADLRSKTYYVSQNFKIYDLLNQIIDFND